MFMRVSQGRLGVLKSINLVACRLLSSTALRADAAPPKLLNLATLTDDEHHALAKDWLDSFTAQDVPKTACEVSYARSSGPGGQHVNKTNSKAIVRCDIHRAKGDWLPPFVVPSLQKSVSQSGHRMATMRAVWYPLLQSGQPISTCPSLPPSSLRRLTPAALPRTFPPHILPELPKRTTKPCTCHVKLARDNRRSRT